MDRRRYLAMYRAAMTTASILRTLRLGEPADGVDTLCAKRKLRQMTEGRDVRSLALPPQTAMSVTLNCATAAQP